MMKSAAGRMGRNKKSSRPFKDFYTEWFETLKSTLLPLLRHSMSASSSSLLSSSSALPITHLGGAMLSSSDLLSTHVQTLHAHFQAYFQALDLAARHDVSQILFPDWRNSLEKPFLWLGDFHPSLFTNLLRSFLDSSSSSLSRPPKPLPFAVAWNSPSRDLIKQIEQIERGLRLMVPALVKRIRDAQAGFVEGVAADWAASKGREDASEEAVRTHMEELASVFADANRLRKSILAEIVGATDVYQGALYLEALSQFVVGFRDADQLHDFEQCKMPLSPGSA